MMSPSSVGVASAPSPALGHFFMVSPFLFKSWALFSGSFQTARLNSRLGSSKFRPPLRVRSSIPLPFPGPPLLVRWAMTFWSAPLLTPLTLGSPSILLRGLHYELRARTHQSVLRILDTFPPSRPRSVTPRFPPPMRPVVLMISLSSMVAPTNTPFLRLPRRLPPNCVGPGSAAGLLLIGGGFIPDAI